MSTNYAAMLKEELGVPFSRLGEKVANILGDAINLWSIDERDKADWGDPLNITIKVQTHHLSTTMFSGLTNLVILCHDRNVRLEIGPRGDWHLLFKFSHCGGYGEPKQGTMESAIEKIRNGRAWRPSDNVGDVQQQINYVAGYKDAINGAIDYLIGCADTSGEDVYEGFHEWLREIGGWGALTNETGTEEAAFTAGVRFARKLVGDSAIGYNFEEDRDE